MGGTYFELDISDKVFQSWHKIMELESCSGSEALGCYGQISEGVLEISVSTLLVSDDNDTNKIPLVKHILYWSQRLSAGVDRVDHFRDDSALPIVIQSTAMITYAERFLCGVKKTCRPGEALETKGEIDG